MSRDQLPQGVSIVGPRVDGSEEVLTPAALEFVAHLHRSFNPVRAALLERRTERQAEINGGATLGLLPDTAAIRLDGSWRVAETPPDLLDRRVEITGPAEPKMIINALNSGARAFMADFEDSLSPTWANVVGGQAALRDAVRGRLAFDSPEGKAYRLNDSVAQLLVRPRGWHLPERHLVIDGEPVSASLFDAGLYLFWNARERLARGTGPYFYLPKLQSHREARLWNNVFVQAQAALGVPRGSVRATVLIETIHAAFEMEEILYELREHSSGLNAGRWDYLFSAIKTFRPRRDSTLPADAPAQPESGAAEPESGPAEPESGPARSADVPVLPDRAQITMAVPFMRAYTERLVLTCHRRGAHAMGGMAAFIPSRRDPVVNEAAMRKVRDDKERESSDGFDGTWVAHPDLVPLATEVFDGVLGSALEQRSRRVEEAPLGEEVPGDPAALLDLRVDGGAVTEAGARLNVSVALQYLDSWLRGDGAAAINNLMEDAATAEISRSQLWQWRVTGTPLDDGQPLTAERYRAIREEELTALTSAAAAAAGAAGPDAARSRLPEAAALLDKLVLDDDFIEFLTLPAYARLR
ncbi:MAG TPA: malate synthase [Candidatus Limnocylindria bacterium]|nr:malate synthase [Candidatus Limnocylindria bacterium]